MPVTSAAMPARREMRLKSTPDIIAMPIGGMNTDSTWFVTSKRSFAPWKLRIRNVNAITMRPVSTVATRAVRRPPRKLAVNTLATAL